MATKSKQNTKSQGRECKILQISGMKKCRTRGRRTRKELILETLKARKGPKQINEYRNKQIIMSLRKESGQFTSDREEILKNMRGFLQITLYPSSAHK